MTKVKSGLAVATAAAAMFALGVMPNVAQAAEGTVKCAGINSCKGTSDCKSADSSCKGQNKCKGQGWVKKTKAECDKAGGKVLS
ncbi:MAG: hypothetical protein ACK5TK_13215 [Betaproteobacteria bacterium]